MQLWVGSWCWLAYGCWSPFVGMVAIGGEIGLERHVRAATQHRQQQNEAEDFEHWRLVRCDAISQSQTAYLQKTIHKMGTFCVFTFRQNRSGERPRNVPRFRVVRAS